MSPFLGISSDPLTAWDKYDQKVRTTLGPIGGRSKRKGTLRLVVNQDSELRDAADDLERGKEFGSFVESVTRAIKSQGYHKGGHSFWEHAIQSALRRSGYYSGVATRRRINSKAVLRRLLQAFEPHDFTVTYLAPMEYVWLKAQRIACRTFTITKFTRAELDEMLNSEICKVFYPWAVADTASLSSYWFLVVREKKSLSPLGKIDVDLGSVGKVTPQYSPYPALEKVLHRLTMYNWMPDWARDNRVQKREPTDKDWKGWLGFKIPFIIRVSENILETPRRAPNLETLETEPYFDPFSGEELGEQPSWYINLDKKESEKLERCLLSVDRTLRTVEPFLANWDFLTRGLGFIVKGFFTKGLEQLLWHITALEAIFGEDRAGITSLMARRVASVLGESEVERREIRKRFEALYRLRSELVHGSELKSEVWEGHLKDARDLARRSLLWFLSFLAVTSKTAKRSSSTAFPDRRAVLAVIDSKPPAIVQLAKVLKAIPPSFPAIKKWQEPWTFDP